MNEERIRTVCGLLVHVVEGSMEYTSPEAALKPIQDSLACSNECAAFAWMMENYLAIQFAVHAAILLLEAGLDENH